MAFEGTNRTISGADDVFIGGTSNKHVLAFNSTTSKWNNINVITIDSLLAELRKTDATAFYSGSAYPQRTTITTDSQRRVRWVGPVPPTIGGNYAIDDLDVWEQTAA